MTPASSEDEYVASEASSNGSESESETLADLEQLRATVATRSQKSKSMTRSTSASSTKKKPPKKKKAVETTDDREKKRSTSFSPEELLLVAKAFILKRTNSDVPFLWGLLEETGRQIVMEIIEDNDQGPSKEWGQFGWYRFPSNEQIENAMQGKTHWDGNVVPI